MQITVIATLVQGLGYVVESFSRQLPHRRNVSLVVEIMMVSSVFRDSQKCLTFGRLWVCLHGGLLVSNVLGWLWYK